MFSEPAVGEKFFGRGEVLDLLNKRVSALKDGYRQNIALTGQSLAGKSSIIHHFLYTLEEEGCVPIYVEVIKEPFMTFSNKFIATLLYNSLTRMGEYVDADLDSLMEKANRLLPKTTLAIKHINSCIDKGQFDEAYSSLLGLTSVSKGETNMSCIVILDEFDNLEYLGVKNPFLNFGKVIMVQKDTMYIVSSSRNQAIKKILSEKLSLLFGNFEIVKIQGFDLKTSSEYIDAKLAGFEIEVLIKRFLIAFTDGNPFYLDRLARRAREIALDRMSNYIDTTVIEQAMLDLIYNPSGVIHQHILNYILELVDTKYKDNYISILLSIANGRNKASDISRSLKCKQGELSKGLSRLVELGLISKNGVFYKIDDVMLGFWLKFIYQSRREMLVDGILDKTAIFGEEVKSYLSNFMLELDKDTVSKLAELFNLFSNELVQIESKYIRLPHFTKVEVKYAADSKTPFIVASFRGKSWVVQAYEYVVSESDIADYIRNVKMLDSKISNKIIMPLNGIDENAKLLAKELKIPIWDTSVVNALLNLYGKNKIIIL